MVVCWNREYLIGISSGITFKDQLIVTLFCSSYSISSLHKNNISWGPIISNKNHERIGNILDANYTTCTHRWERVKSFSPASLITKCTQTVFLYHYLEIVVEYLHHNLICSRTLVLHLLNAVTL